MKATKLIKLLQDQVDFHGDFSVYIEYMDNPPIIGPADELWGNTLFFTPFDAIDESRTFVQSKPLI